MSKNELKILLLIEDNPGDARLLREMLQEHESQGTVLTHVEYMSEAEKHLARNVVDMILLDLNMPRMDGREVLALIKKDDNLKTIPTVILTSSQAEADVVKSYQLQANCYLSKPMHFEAFHNLVKSINDFWLTKVKLPQQEKSG